MKCPDDFVTLSRLRLLFGLSFLIPNFGRPCTDTHCETTTCPHKEQLKTVKLQFWPSNHWLLPLFSPLYRRWILTVFPADRTSPEKLSGHMDTAYRYIATQDTITDQYGRLPTLLLLEISTETGHLDHDCWYALPPISIAETSTTAVLGTVVPRGTEFRQPRSSQLLEYPSASGWIFLAATI